MKIAMNVGILQYVLVGNALQLQVSDFHPGPRINPPIAD